MIGLTSSAARSQVVSHAGADSGASLHLELNVPARRLDLLARDSVVRTFRVAVGMRRYPTPLGRFIVSWVEWNPWWIPPDSPWAKDEKVTPPGPENPMGRVKIGFGPMYFLHGTPWPESIGRAASHGCVRMLNADAEWLATFLQLRGAAASDSARVEAAARDTVTRRESLREQPLLTIRYETVEVRGDSLYLWLDTYRRDGITVPRILAVLATHGIDTAGVDRRRLRTLSARAVTRAQAASLASLSVAGGSR
jgi:murein L,D-transpeptidase YcbB/YkuD